MRLPCAGSVRLFAAVCVMLLARFAPPASAQAARGARATGLLQHQAGAFEGYTLFAPLSSRTTYLIDMRGEVVHSWLSDLPPGYSVYLLESGNLLRCAREPGDWVFTVAGLGGRVQELEWDGSVAWELRYADQSRMQHHDIERLPNGNVLLVAWERKSTAEAIAAGRDPELLRGGEMWPDHVVEIQPDGSAHGKIVWEWHVWDHLIQDHDTSKANFGVVAAHPELVDVNAPGALPAISAQERRQLEALGYVEAAPAPRAAKGKADWTHVNAIAYNAELDQIALSVLRFSELWVIDHSTTSEEAAGHSGGRHGRGGDLLYRWGNPQTWRAGEAADQRLFEQHDVHWIPPGLPGAGNLLVFNNGDSTGERSSVVEIRPPLAEDGSYERQPGEAFGPAEPCWSWAGEQQAPLRSRHLSGAQRLPNGNTLICSGDTGRFVEIDAAGKIVWEYRNPMKSPTREVSPAQAEDRSAGGWTSAVFRATRLAPDHPGLSAHLTSEH